MDLEAMAINACSDISAASELGKAATIQETLRYVEKILAVRTPASVTRYLLQEGSATRVAALKHIAEETAITLVQVRQAAEQADALLKLRAQGDARLLKTRLMGQHLVISIFAC
jgi:hypothetical protein